MRAKFSTKAHEVFNEQKTPLCNAGFKFDINRNNQMLNSPLQSVPSIYMDELAG
jgi:hypothetical protein